MQFRREASRPFLPSGQPDSEMKTVVTDGLNGLNLNSTAFISLPFPRGHSNRINLPGTTLRTRTEKPPANSGNSQVTSVFSFIGALAFFIKNGAGIKTASKTFLRGLRMLSSTLTVIFFIYSP